MSTKNQPNRNDRLPSPWPNPTGSANEAHYLPDYQLIDLIGKASNVSIMRHPCPEWHADADLIECDIDGAPTVILHLRKIDGKPQEEALAWHRDTLRHELQSITDAKKLAHVLALFGAIGLKVINEPERIAA